MRSFVLLVMVGLLAGAATGCSDNDPVAPNGLTAGVYTLAEVNGQGLPYTFHPDPVRMEVMGGSMRLDADNRFVETVTFLTVNGDTGQELEETETRTGTWARDGHSLTLTADGGAVTYAGATLSEGTLSYTATGAFSFDLTLERDS